MVRIILAGVIGGVAMFLWGGFAHMMTPLGHMGVNEIPGESAAVAALQESLGDKDGLYYFPGFGLGHHPSAEEAKDAMPAYKEKYKTSPSGLLVYHPARGGDVMEARYFIGELSLEIVEAILCAFLLSAAMIGGLISRVAFVTGVGLVVAITTNGSYWNWYGFPLDYTLAYGFIELVGFAIAGVVIALILKKPGKA